MWHNYQENIYQGCSESRYNQGIILFKPLVMKGAYITIPKNFIVKANRLSLIKFL